MKKQLLKEELLAEFKPMVKEGKINRYIELIDSYNALIFAFNELLGELTKRKQTDTQVQNSIETTNAILRRLGISDRIKDINTLAQTISNIFWKLNVQETRSVPEVPFPGRVSDIQP